MRRNLTWLLMGLAFAVFCIVLCWGQSNAPIEPGEPLSARLIKHANETRLLAEEVARKERPNLLPEAIAPRPQIVRKDTHLWEITMEDGLEYHEVEVSKVSLEGLLDLKRTNHNAVVIFLTYKEPKR